MMFPLSTSWRRGPVSAAASRRALPRNGSKRRTRVALECLEGRAMMAADTWLTAGGGDWDTAANWSQGVPTANTDVSLPLIGGSGYTVTHSVADSDAALSVAAANGVSVTVTAGTLQINSGTLDGLIVSGAGNFVENTGNISANAVAIGAGGSYTIWGGGFSPVLTAGQLVVDGGGTLTVHSGIDTDGVSATITAPSFTNNGEIDVQSIAALGHSFPSTLTVTNGFNNAGTLLIDAEGANSSASLSMPTAMTNTGTIQLETPYASTTSTVALSVTGGTLTNSQGATIEGTGTIATSLLDNSGTVNPGSETIPAVVANTGTITVNGAYTQEASGTLQINVGTTGTLNYTTTGRLNSQLLVSGAVTEGGTLNVTPLGSYTPNNSTLYQVLSDGSVSGSFSTTTLPPLTNSTRPLLTINDPYGLSFSNVSPVGDMQGTGKTSLSVYRVQNGQIFWLIRLSNGTNEYFTFGDPTQNDIPVPGDYEGIGKSDFAVFRPATGQWIAKSGATATAGQALPIITFGAGQEAVPANYDGSGKTQLAVFNKTTDVWTIRHDDGTTTQVQFGDPSQGDIPVPGDYEGIGKADLAVFRPSADLWIIRLASGGTRILQFGDTTQHDIPASGAYGFVSNVAQPSDGSTQLAVFEPSQAYWIVLDPGNHAASVYQFGDPAHNDTPTRSPYVSL